MLTLLLNVYVHRDIDVFRDPVIDEQMRVCVLNVQVIVLNKQKRILLII